MNNKQLNILMLEDQLTDAALIERALQSQGVDFVAKRVETEQAFLEAIDTFEPDILLADYKLPQYNGRLALDYVRRTHPFIPVIVVTGSLGEEEAVELLKAGAKDYILKDRLGRLGQAVIRAVAWEAGRRHRKEMEDNLRESEEKFHGITASAQDAILMQDHVGRISYWNAAAEKIFGYSEEEALGQELHALIAPERFREAFKKGFAHFMETGEGPMVRNTLELIAIRKGGTEFPIALSLSAIMLKGSWHAIGIVRDITVRKNQEASIKKLNALLLAIRHINEHLLITRDEQELFDFICNTLHSLEHMVVVWIGLKLPDLSVQPVAWAGDDRQTMLSMHGRWDESDRGGGMVGTAIKLNSPTVITDTEHDPRLLPWRNFIIKWQAKSGAAMPLAVDGEVIGALTILSDRADTFDEETVRFLAEVAGDIGLGLRTLRLGKALSNSLSSLKKSLDSTVETIASIVEFRDPYTAGHERRVAQLAVAIGKELGLSEHRLEGLRVAGYIHDLGKIAVPAEILSKPSKLNEIEHKLVMEHARVGHELLKNLDFPWPIADMVLQHHERLDGSGYPQGLKGEQILFEARILSIADVVEAMSSHRPYRPGMGIEPALAEIESKRGVLYDPEIVDACIKLFRERGYTLPV